MATRPGTRLRAHERVISPSLSAEVLAEARVAEVLGSTFAWFLSPIRLAAKAEDLRLLRRQGRIDVGLVVVAVVLSALARNADGQGRVLDAFALFRQLGGAHVTKEGFRKRMKQSAPLLRALLDERLQQLATTTWPALRGRLAHFTDLLIPDGTIFKLATAFAGVLPGSGSAAALKLHAVYSVRAQAATTIEFTAGREHDNPHFTPAWVHGALYLWDLGFNDYSRVIDAIDAEAHLIQRLKDSGNPVVTAWYDSTGSRHPLVHADGTAMRLNDAVAQGGPLEHQPVLDLDATLTDARHRQATVRLVCVPFQGTDAWYLTTLSREHFTPYDIAELYGCRWDVELLFKDWQGGARLDEVQSVRHLDTLRACVYGSLLASLLARDVALAAEDPHPAISQPIQIALPAVPTAFSP
jgi:putative transposase